MMTDKEYDIIRTKYFEEWFQSGGCDENIEAGFWRGYEACMQMHNLTKYVKTEGENK